MNISLSHGCLCLQWLLANTEVSKKEIQNCFDRDDLLRLHRRHLGPPSVAIAEIAEQLEADIARVSTEYNPEPEDSMGRVWGESSHPLFRPARHANFSKTLSGLHSVCGLSYGIGEAHVKSWRDSEDQSRAALDDDEDEDEDSEDSDDACGRRSTAPAVLQLIRSLSRTGITLEENSPETVPGRAAGLNRFLRTPSEKRRWNK